MMVSLIVTGKNEDSLSDGPIDVRNDDQIGVIPDKYPCCTCYDAGSGQGERDCIRAGLKVKLL